jgi:hypothetical protein
MASPPNHLLDIARRVELRAESGYTWLVLILSDEPGENSIADVRDELEAALNATVRIVTPGNAHIHDVVSSIVTRPDDVVLLCDLDDWDDESWAAFDIQRSALERKGAIVLVLSSASLVRLGNVAPNIRSYIGGSIFQLAPAGGIMTSEDRDSRVKELEEHFGLSSQQVVEKAEQHTLILDPTFVEWLVLLGMGDLV